ncbi:hypothetical protein AAKU55_004613 [Oxalobacteraceae bacterium GrIS 1.11]
MRFRHSCGDLIQVASLLLSMRSIGLYYSLCAKVLDKRSFLTKGYAHVS